MTPALTKLILEIEPSAREKFLIPWIISSLVLACGTTELMWEFLVDLPSKAVVS